MVRHHITNWGFDTAILGMPEWDKHEHIFRPTYLYRYDIAYHVSMRNGRKSYPITSLPVIQVGLLRDYEVDADSFLRKISWHKII